MNSMIPEWIQPDGPGEEEYNDRDLEELEALAEERGCTLVVGDDTTLTLDLDGGEKSLRTFVRVADLMVRKGVMPAYSGATMWKSRSGGNHHVLITLMEPLPLDRRILLQALLGSDPMRESLAYWRYVKGIQNPLVLFKPLDAVEEEVLL